MTSNRFAKFAFAAACAAVIFAGAAASDAAPLPGPPGQKAILFLGIEDGDNATNATTEDALPTEADVVTSTTEVSTTAEEPTTTTTDTTTTTEDATTTSADPTTTTVSTTATPNATTTTTTTAPNPANDDDDNGGGFSTRSIAIIAAVVAGVVLLSVAAAAFIYRERKKRSVEAAEGRDVDLVTQYDYHDLNARVNDTSLMLTDEDAGAPEEIRPE